MRGSGSLVGVVTAKETERNYVPSRPQPSYRTVLMIGKAEANAGEFKPVKRNNEEGADASGEERKPIQSLFTILKNEFDKNKNDKMETVEKWEKNLMDRKPSHSKLSLRERASTRTHLRGA